MARSSQQYWKLDRPHSRNILCSEFILAQSIVNKNKNFRGFQGSPFDISKNDNFRTCAYLYMQLHIAFTNKGVYLGNAKSYISLYAFLYK